MNGFLTLSALTANALAILALQPPHTLPMLLSDSFFFFTPLTKLDSHTQFLSISAFLILTQT